MPKLIDSPDTVGIDPDEVRTNPGVLIEIHEDVLRELMQTSAPIERQGLKERGDADHPRRRMCV